MKTIDLGYGCENSMPNKGKIVIYTEHNGEIFYCTGRPHFCDLFVLKFFFFCIKHFKNVCHFFRFLPSHYMKNVCGSLSVIIPKFSILS